MSGARMNWQRWLMMLPAVIFFGVFALVPMFVAVYYSGLNWSGVGHAQWVGVQNWTHAFSDGQALHSLWLTIELMVLCWILQNPLSLVLGVFMAGKKRHRVVYGVIFFIPLLFSAVAIGVTWSYILDPEFGLLDSVLKSIGIGNGAENWIGNPHIAMLVVACIIAWQFIPFNSLLYQSGVRQIPDSLYEAAMLDGANPIQTFFRITLPQLKYTIVTTTVLILTGTLTYFDLIYVVTNGGPGDSTNVLAMYMYKEAFHSLNIGAGSVIAVILAVFGLLLSIVILKFTGFTKMESQMEGS
ncbi:carbohydrate ABC transporter permease [Alicyclobacillus sp. SO9]|uniref:carbohydrate ABC transporter permease n=1 Tax=Alicyclobacillus sp. SO9 TaxID=2665646 RepID=UPI0018E84DD6|nr:sugar ABC transporter permease [Alicyclobacillus sp. SO9]QQE78194.1 sugar ABC transporter permease [Alicyclobacillus sp. SO9]